MSVVVVEVVAVAVIVAQAVSMTVAVAVAAGFFGYYQYPGSHNGLNQVPYCNIGRTSVYTLDIHTAELLYTAFDANSWTNGLLGATTGKVQQD